MSQEIIQLYADIKSVLAVNAAADQKIQSLIDQGIQSESTQKSRVSSEVELAAKSLSHLKNMLDAEQKQGQQQ